MLAKMGFLMDEEQDKNYMIWMILSIQLVTTEWAYVVMESDQKSKINGQNDKFDYSVWLMAQVFKSGLHVRGSIEKYLCSLY